MKHYTLFIDESGKSSLIEKTGEPFILTGIILNDEDIRTVEGFFTYIKRKYGINMKMPFHSYDLFENQKSKISDLNAKALLITIADFISLIPIKMRIVQIDKSLFKNSLGVQSNEDFKGDSKKKEIKEYPYRIMSSKLFAWFSKHLDKNDGIGQIIIDARRGGDHQLLQSLNLCKDPNGPLDSETSKLIKERCNAICFAEKYFFSGGLEITDLISYSAFFHARRTMNSMNHIKLNLVWRKVKENLPNKCIQELNRSEIQRFFRIGEDGVHKYLKRA